MVELVCAHTHPVFVRLNKDPTKCPWCFQKMNPIARKTWQGSINGYFHAQIEMVCSNEECPYKDGFVPDWTKEKESS